MINISFDNPYLLLIAIPLLALIVVPICIAIRRDNRSKSVIISTILHVLMVLCITFAVAGTEVTAVMTQTQIYVVADVSYSAHANLDVVDEYVRKVEKEAPRGADVGVVCFGRDYQLLTPLGEDFTSVKNATVDNGATDISSALTYTGTLFGSDVVKRIVLITDGKESGNDATALIDTVKKLHASGVQIDVMYVDNNALSSANEVQISGVEFLSTTYKNRQSTASVLVQSSYNANGYVSLFKGEELVKREPVSLTQGFNIVNFDLTADTAGTFDYLLKAEIAEDSSSYNNEYRFTQEVVESLKVLALTNEKADETAIKNMYGEHAELTTYRVTSGKKTVPCTVEELCGFDEIILSGIDIKTIENYPAFVNSLDIVVSTFGKTLITLGNMEIQNNTDNEALTKLDDMLPVNYGKNETDPKLLCIAIDISRSMNQAERLKMAKMATKSLIELLGPNDEVSIVYFSDSAKVEVQPTEIKDEQEKQEIFETIDGFEPNQGTYIGDAMNEIYTTVAENDGLYQEIQAMLITDGLDYSGETEFKPKTIASNLYKNYNVPVSAINIGCDDSKATSLLGTVVSVGHGHYYYVRTPADVEALMLGDVAEDLTQSVVEKSTPVHIARLKDDILENIVGENASFAFSNVKGFVNSKAKKSANTVLTVDSERASGGIVQAPLYAYWNYGNGRVCTYTSSIAGTWASGFADEKGLKLFENIVTKNVPETISNLPYSLSLRYDGVNIEVDMTPAVVDPNALLTVEITSPDGNILETRDLAFDVTHYFGEFACNQLGKYAVKLTYVYGGVELVKETAFNLSYLSEYDAFQAYDVSVLYSAVRNMGKVTEDGSISFDVSEDMVETYSMHLTIPLMIATVCLFVVDVAIRKLKWEDILGLFAKKTKKGDK